MPELNVGPFALESAIGKGAMGEVWKGRHRDRGIPVAVKVMTAREARNSAKVKSFFNEVRAVAQLDHPGIAWVLDYGTVGATAAAASEGHLLAESPYLAMEYASRGTLADIKHSYNWTEIRAVLLALLDGLAHAHARGVIHRDLKPANVLLCSRHDVRPGLKLCDFGIAFAMEEARDDSIVAGTLHYMAPEQLEARQREQGPWTDLYALGCLTWRMLTGHPPHHGKRQTQLIFAQLKDDPPPLLTPTPIPDGFELWLRTLLQKNPLDRFRCAADAARALIDLGRPVDHLPDEDLMTGIIKPVLLTHKLLSPPPKDAATVVPRDSADLAAEPTTLFLSGPKLDWASPGAALEPSAVRAALPLDWRRPARARPTLDLVGAGLQLFGLRRPPFVGREAARDTIWEALHRVHTERRCHAVILDGSEGVGKTRLAMWIAQRASEVGSGQVLTARFSGNEDPDAALRTMLLRRFQALGLEADGLTERLDDALDDLGITNQELRQHVHTLLGGRKLQGASRYVVIRLLLEAVSIERPVILVLDDVHSGIDGLRFARHILNAQAVRPFPILILLTVRGAEVEGAGMGPELTAVSEDKRVQSMDVSPLPREPFMELVRHLLGLEPALAGQVVERTAGNPLFAIQLIGDWVERKQLRLGSRGFKLKRGAPPELPSDLKRVWEQRLTRVLENQDDATIQMLEGAAVLGLEVDELEWARMCDDPEGVHREHGRVRMVPENARRRFALIEHLFQLNLANETEAGFQFTHSQFRDAILQQARRAERLPAHHRAAARQLGESAKDSQLERYGRHLLAAGEPLSAVDPLLRAVPVVQATVGRLSAWRLLDTVDHALQKLELPRSDVRWGRLHIQRAILAEALGRLREGSRWAARAGADASRYSWTGIAAAANFHLARAAMRAGDLDLAGARLVRVTNQLDPKESPFEVGEALFLLGRIARQTREPEAEVQRLMKAGRGWMLKDPDPRLRTRALLHLARAAIEDGQPAICRALAEKARKIAVKLGDLPQQVNCLNFSAEVARGNGDLPAAADNLRRAIEVFELIGDAQLALLRANLAQVLLDQGDQQGALKELDRALSNAIEVGRDRLQFSVQTVRLRALAEAGRFSDVAEALSSCEELLPRIKKGEADSAVCAERAFAILTAKGHGDLAERARAIAVHQYKKLRDKEALGRLEEPG